MMSGVKRKGSLLGCDKDKVKRKHISLTIENKVEILQMLDRGLKAKHAAEKFGVATRTIYDISKNKDKILSFYVNSDDNISLASRKTMHQAKNVSHDAVLYEWFRQRREEGIPISGPLLQVQAKKFHQELNLKQSCDYSSGWLHRFRQRHGIRFLAISGEKESADKPAADAFTELFTEYIKKNNLCADQIYNMDETGLMWRCLPKKTLTCASEVAPSGLKSAKERVTVALCSNAAGTHKLKPYVIGKSAKPRALKGVKVLPVQYASNKNAWITKELTSAWFKSFVREARDHCEKKGLGRNCKILLVLDNCTAHPGNDVLQADDVDIMFLPPNTTSILQPMDQGIIHAFKCGYKSNFMLKLLDSGLIQETLEKSRKNFTIKTCLYLIANSWENVEATTLTNGWHKLWPGSYFVEHPEIDDFKGFYNSKTKEKANELMNYAKAKGMVTDILEEEVMLDWFNEDVPVTSKTDEEIVADVLCRDEDSDDTDSETETDTTEQKLTLTEGFELGEKYLAFLEQQNFVTPSEIMFMQRVQDKIAKQRPVLKQLKINDMFKK